jgi:2-phosphosulfolactate phosphatase
MNIVEVCLLPELYPHRGTKGKHVAVIVDVLRATTTITVALQQGCKEVIPVTDLHDLQQYKQKGYITISERDGLQTAFADFGNSPLQLISNHIKDKTIAISTTNGTRAIAMVDEADKIFLGAFVNLSALAAKLKAGRHDVVIVCSGWKHRFSLEDTLFAGALCEKLTSDPCFSFNDDSTLASMDLWKTAKNHLQDYVSQVEHYKRLYALGMGESVPYCFQTDICTAVPVLEKGAIVRS